MELKRYQFAISVIALVVSIGSATTAAYFSSLSMKLGIKPALILVKDEFDRWTVQNVGNGPAFNILVTCMPHDGDKNGGIWTNPIHFYPISRNGKITLIWMGANPNKIGVSYSDVNNKPHTSITDNDLTTFGGPLPKWTENEIKASWRVTTKYCP